MRGRVFEILSQREAAFTFAWLARHRDRIRAVLLGGKRIGVLVFIDRGADHPLGDLSTEDKAAIRQLIDGDAIDVRDDA